MSHKRTAKAYCTKSQLCNIGKSFRICKSCPTLGVLIIRLLENFGSAHDYECHPISPAFRSISIAYCSVMMGFKYTPHNYRSILQQATNISELEMINAMLPHDPFLALSLKSSIFCCRRSLLSWVCEVWTHYKFEIHMEHSRSLNTLTDQSSHYHNDIFCHTGLLLPQIQCYTMQTHMFSRNFNVSLIGQFAYTQIICSFAHDLHWNDAYYSCVLLDSHNMRRATG